MPSNILITEDKKHYSITSPNWICEWIIINNSTNIYRSLSIFNNSIEIDFSDIKNTEYVMNLLPGLFDEVQDTVLNWIKEGDIEAHRLLEQENLPSYLRYSQQILRKKFHTR